jgi:hypothetical protein
MAGDDKHVIAIGASQQARARLIAALVVTRKAHLESDLQAARDGLVEAAKAAKLTQDPLAGALRRLAIELDALIGRYALIDEAFVATAFPEEFSPSADSPIEQLDVCMCGYEVGDWATEEELP